MRDQNRIDLRSAQSVNNRISCDAQVAKTVDTLVCCRPNIAFTVLEEFEYIVARQTICPSKMLYSVPIDAIHPLVAGPYPQGTLAIHQQGFNAQIAAVESRCDPG